MQECEFATPSAGKNSYRPAFSSKPGDGAFYLDDSSSPAPSAQALPPPQGRLSPGASSPPLTGCGCSPDLGSHAGSRRPAGRRAGGEGGDAAPGTRDP